MKTSLVGIGWVLAILCSASAMAAAKGDWRREVIYMALVDRFANGDSRNDHLHGDPECNDPSDPHAYQGGDLAGLTGKLDYIKDLGATTVWVTPLYKGVAAKAGENCGFPGYWADFSVPYRVELDPRFGEAAEFDLLIREAHRRRMKVMLDMVVNHAGYNSQIFQQRPEWFTDPSTCSRQGAPEIYCSLAGLPDFDQRRSDVREYLTDVHLQWLERFAFDGIRMDTVKHVEPWFFGRDWLPAMRHQREDLYVVGEILEESSFELFQPYLDAGFDGLFNFPLRTGLILTFAQGHSVDVAAASMRETLRRFGNDRAGLLVNLIDNHDVPRFLQNIPAGVSNDQARQRYLLALTALITLPGIPQIYYGNEIGMYGGHDPDNRRFMPEWAFSRTGRRGNHGTGYLGASDTTHAYIQKLLTLKKSHAALEVGQYSELWRQNGAQNANVWVFQRTTEEDNSRVIVAINNGLRKPDEPLRINVSSKFRDGEILDDALGQTSFAPVVVQNSHIYLDLPGKTSLILIPRSRH